MSQVSNPAAPPGADDATLLGAIARVRSTLRSAVSQRIVGQEDVIDALLVALFARGHCLFVGVPGLAKTLLVHTTAEALGLDFGRVQFTPDLMPADVTGTEVLEEDRATGKRVLRFIRGPVFTNLLLADEINRTPPRTQAALLQAMAEGHVTVAGVTHPLAPPFLVFATQNPIEQEGTYPLPEAQLDRFMFSVNVGYPSEAEEIAIVERTTGEPPGAVTPVLDKESLLAFQGLVRRVPAHADLIAAAVRLVRATRPGPGASEEVRRLVQWGAGPRASQYLVLGAKARAALLGSEIARMEDLRWVAPLVLGHRVLLNFQAEAEGKSAPDLVKKLVTDVLGR